jgi:predicted DNA-binding transcriptional regulator AlpA
MKDSIELDGRMFDHSHLVAQRFQISAATVRRWVRRGLLPKPVRLGSNAYYDRSEVDFRVRRGE